jgi:2,3-bisphosphoglycerate-independent phosphoglycerate mutase
VQDDFQEKNPGAFRRSRVAKNIRFVAMTDFGPDLPGVFTAFPSPDVPHALAEAIGEAYRQLFISETEKYAHVTYFINGGYAEPINGEKRELVASVPVKSFADSPGMSALIMADRIVSVFTNDEYDFVCTNFPNADMVGHTGNFKAAEEAVRILDSAVSAVVEALLEMGGQVMIVADHGNAEGMINTETGDIMTEHTRNPVPCIIIGKGYTPGLLHKGGLSDVAPTLLQIMGISPPKEMTGKSLFI